MVSPFSELDHRSTHHTCFCISDYIESHNLGIWSSQRVYHRRLGYFIRSATFPCRVTGKRPDSGSNRSGQDSRTPLCHEDSIHLARCADQHEQALRSFTDRLLLTTSAQIWEGLS